MSDDAIIANPILIHGACTLHNDLFFFMRITTDIPVGTLRLTYEYYKMILTPHRYLLFSGLEM